MTRAARRPPARHSTNGTGHPPVAPAVDNVSRAYQELRALIVSGQLSPGTRVAERAVVERIGLSRTPLRSALHRLQQDGLVASVGRPGHQRLIVTPLTQEDGREVFLIVGHLEGLAAREAATLPADRRKMLVHRLRDINRSLAIAARRSSSPSRLFELDEQFHRTYVEGAFAPRLLTLHRAIKPQAERYARLYVDVLLDQLATSVKEHGVIVTAIAKGAPAAAQKAAETNWRNAAARLSRLIDEHGERGVWHLLRHEPFGDSPPRHRRSRQSGRSPTA